MCPGLNGSEEKRWGTIVLPLILCLSTECKIFIKSGSLRIVALDASVFS